MKIIINLKKLNMENLTERQQNLIFAALEYIRQANKETEILIEYDSAKCDGSCLIEDMQNAFDIEYL